MLRDVRLKLIAAATVALLHVGIYQLLSHSGGAARRTGPAAEVMVVEFIARARPPDVAPPPPSRMAAARKRRAASERLPAEIAPAPVEPAAAALSAEPLVLGWQEAEPTDPESRRNPAPTDTATAFPVSPPDRMRMRRQITGKDIVEGTAQMLGMWPPGYESDPCPRVKRNIANLMTDASASGRERLGEEVRRQRVACSQ